MSTMIQNIQAKLTELDGEIKTIRNAVETEQRLMTSEEEVKMEKAQADYASLSKQLRLLGDGEQIQNAISAPRPKVASRPAMSLIETSPAYKHMGLFLQDVKLAGQGRTPERLLNAVSSAGVEGTNAAGGYAVPNDLRREIQEKALGEGSLLARCDRYGTFSNVLTFPLDIVNPWDTTYGGADIHVAETGTYSEVTPSLSQTSVTVGKLGVACSISEELLEDSLAMGAFVSKKLGERLQNRINADIVSGTGANGCYGFLNWGNKATVTTSSGDVSGSVRISGDDILNMYYTMPANQRGNGVWLVSDSLEPYLAKVKLSGATMYNRPGDFQNKFVDTASLWGRPVLVIPQCASVGNAGDIVFADFSQYLAVTKGDVATDVTPYVYWLNDTMTFKCHIRIGGKPWRNAGYTMGDGSTRASFVVLAGGR